MQKKLLQALLFLILFLVNPPISGQSLEETKYNAEGKGRVLGVSENIKENLNADLGASDLPAVPDAIRRPMRQAAAGNPAISSIRAIIVDAASGETLLANEENKVQPIASLTKLFAALTFLDWPPDWQAKYIVKATDIREGGVNHILAGDRLTVRDLFDLSLVASDNSAIIALVSSSGRSESDFVGQMNQKAKAMGLKDTFFIDPIGLGDGNISTAKEVALFVKAALDNEDIRKAVQIKEFWLAPEERPKIKIESTNKLLSVYPPGGKIEIIGGKTGYTKKAGYCFAGEFADKAGDKIITVALGAVGPDTRFDQTKKLVRWTFDNYEWR